MELGGHSLKDILIRKPQVFGRQPGEPMNSIEFYISCHIFKELLECVQYLHELSPQIIHRDLKPDNILLAKNVRKGSSLELSIYSGYEIYEKFIKLDQIIDSMSAVIDTRRPECSPLI
ncbi:unnamed protein product [Oppiella nova]|uniref:Protein kinase domain-containing protein n=1 Tax=Oppiella nova TaxID=334625 RepID=A0A7R9M4C7_9ACAR|nr:unnamed protein product [Oppiella nova]CAG2170518.1 unnamed protein product [Oppiella nova]